ncbi:phosphoserine phosphatase SerB [Corynebacterium phocae]|nr:phosphoserine phosphatase SerB [Corynebacterium phocae]
MIENRVTVLAAPHLDPGFLNELESSSAVTGIRELSQVPVSVVEVRHSGTIEVPPELGIDKATLPEQRPRRGIICFDCDSTLITGEVIDMLAAHAGRAAEVAEVTERAMRGELDFAESLRERVAALAGLNASILEETAAALELSPGVEETIRVLKAEGFTVAIVSGGFIQVLDPLAAKLGADYVSANTLEIKDGKLTGKVTGQIIDRAVKEEFLREVAQKVGVGMEHTVAVGDGANDIDMVRAAGLGVAYKAKPALKEFADAEVNFHMTQVLHLLGVRR